MMARTVMPLLAAVMAVALAVLGGGGAAVKAEEVALRAFRLSHFAYGDAVFGVKSADLTLFASSAAAADMASTALVRQIVVVRMGDLEPEAIGELARKRASGLLVVLPPASIDGEEIAAAGVDVEKWMRVEEALLRADLNVAVYFAHETEALGAIVDELERMHGPPVSAREVSMSGTVVQATVGKDKDRGNVIVGKDGEAPGQSSVAPVNVVNVQGWLQGIRTAASSAAGAAHAGTDAKRTGSATAGAGDEDDEFANTDATAASGAGEAAGAGATTTASASTGSGSSITPSRTVAIVAHYDTLTLAPGLHTSVAGTSKSGVVALLALAQAFSGLYATEGRESSTNLLFVVTGGDAHNFAGTKNWLANAPSELVFSLDLVICLESVGGDELYLHRMQQGPADNQQQGGDFMQSAVAAFQDATAAVPGGRSVPLHVQDHQINVTRPMHAWQHEVFFMKNVHNTFTVSSSSRPLQSNLLGQSLATAIQTPKPAVLKRNIVFLAEALGRILYDKVDASQQVFTSAGAVVSDEFVDQWSTKLAAEPTSIPYMHSSSNLVSSMVEALQKWCTNGDANAQSYALNSVFKFGGAASVQIKLNHVKPALFDLVVTGIILVYLLALYVAFKGGPGNIDFKEIFAVERR